MTTALPQNAIKILGIDPGTLKMGWGLIAVDPKKPNEFIPVAWDCIRMNSKMPHSERLKKIFQDLIRVIETHHPDESAIENIFHAKNARSALVLGQARGAAMVALSSQGLSVGEYTPLDVKKTVTGYGRADKEQVQTMVCTTLGIQPPKTFDESDALAVAITHAACRQSPFLK